MARPGLPRAYFDELARQIDRLPEGVIGAAAEPSTLRLTRAGRAHRRAARMCYRALTELKPASGPDAWWIEVEPDVRLPEDLLGVPDLAGWRATRVDPLPDEGPVTQVPDWCCKVISADTAKNYRVTRLPFYARAAVRWFWLIDPMARTLEVLTSKEGGEQAELVSVLTAKEDEMMRLPPFEGAFPLSSLWLT